MKTLSKQTVRAMHHEPQTIACTYFDQLLKNYPVPIVIFFANSVASENLLHHLSKVLAHFPLFAGRIKWIDQLIHIDCNNAGVNCTIVERCETLAQVLKNFHDPNVTHVVTEIDNKKALKGKFALLTIKISYFADGGMSIGVCWHHCVGDMQTATLLLTAWSKSIVNEEYVKPIIPDDRAQYHIDHIAYSVTGAVGVRYLSIGSMLKLAYSLLVKNRKKTTLYFYLSEAEVNTLKAECIAKSGMRVSTNDVILAHMFACISGQDNGIQERLLSFAINYRSRLNLPTEICGNFIAALSQTYKSTDEAHQIAANIRTSIQHYAARHFDYFHNVDLVDRHGGATSLGRIIPNSIDPIKHNISVTNWSNFGVYDLHFGCSKPLFFSPHIDIPVPWAAAVVEGFKGNGYFYVTSLPERIVKKLTSKEGLAEIHKYRKTDAVLPELATNLAWVL